MLWNGRANTEVEPGWSRMFGLIVSLEAMLTRSFGWNQGQLSSRCFGQMAERQRWVNDICGDIFNTRKFIKIVESYQHWCEQMQGQQSDADLFKTIAFCVHIPKKWSHCAGHVSMLSEWFPFRCVFPSLSWGLLGCWISCWFCLKSLAFGAFLPGYRQALSCNLCAQ